MTLTPPDPAAEGAPTGAIRRTVPQFVALAAVVIVPIRGVR